MIVSLTIFQNGQNKMLQGAFPDKVTHDTDFTVDTVFQCDVPIAKILF